MMLKPDNQIRTDVLVIGGGGAGLRAAIEARERGARVLVISQSRVGYGSNTTIAGGAVAAVLSPSRGRRDPLDSPEQHLADTVGGGRFINDQSMVQTVADGADGEVEALRRFGVEFAAPEAHPWLRLSYDPGHSRRRIIHGRTFFGTDFTFPLRRYALAQGVEFREGVLITRLLMNRGAVVGAMGIDSKGEAVVFAAPAVVLATGGLGQVYSRTDNTGGSTGDGYVLAYKAGAVLQDMEFVQYYPACMGLGSPALFYESLLIGTRARLLNAQGEDIVEKYGLTDPMSMTRDRLSIAIGKEWAASEGLDGKVVLDLEQCPPDRMEVMWPVMPKAVLKGERRLAVAPAVHFHMGGVIINGRAETSVPGLYAACEVTAGVHGANRLSGNALTEAWVFGAIAGREAARRAKETDAGSPPRDEVAAELQRLQGLTLRRNGEAAKTMRRSLRDSMWQNAGIIRDARSLNRALGEITGLRASFDENSVGEGRMPQSVERLGNLLAASEMICRAALYRGESRGAHYRRDCPEQNDADWLVNVVIANKDGMMSLTTEPVELTEVQPPGEGV
ncbi:MAG: FAD-binding protein [Dehalococcoidia bacterium]|nr:FAD-binding protein [Dehalococcoidia bacterium]